MGKTGVADDETTRPAFTRTTIGATGPLRAAGTNSTTGLCSTIDGANTVAVSCQFRKVGKDRKSAPFFPEQPRRWQPDHPAARSRAQFFSVALVN
jgi:hypothetical protein